LTPGSGTANRAQDFEWASADRSRVQQSQKSRLVRPAAIRVTWPHFHRTDEHATAS
jgi:hypothetical protein